ncbi:Maf family protein [bacterium]|nr:Maf family protein [bacterium]
MTQITTIVLASGSKFRQEILRSTGLEFDVKTSKVDESKIVEKTGQDMALARANAKALAVATGLEGTLVIGADQTLSLDDKIFDKAQSREEAEARLNEFSGKIHHLHSAVVLYLADSGETKKIGEFCVNVSMTMKTLSALTVSNYLDTNEWKGCVGCYQAENKGSLLFEKVGGNNTSVIGLPICELSGLLEDHGIFILDNSFGPWELK